MQICYILSIFSLTGNIMNLPCTFHKMIFCGSHTHTLIWYMYIHTLFPLDVLKELKHHSFFLFYTKVTFLKYFFHIWFPRDINNKLEGYVRTGVILSLFLSYASSSHTALLRMQQTIERVFSVSHRDPAPASTLKCASIKIVNDDLLSRAPPRHRFKWILRLCVDC